VWAIDNIQKTDIATVLQIQINPILWEGVEPLNGKMCDVSLLTLALLQVSGSVHHAYFYANTIS